MPLSLGRQCDVELFVLQVESIHFSPVYFIIESVTSLLPSLSVSQSVGWLAGLS